MRLFLRTNIVPRESFNDVAEHTVNCESKHRATGAHVSQHCFIVAVKPFLYARKEVQATSNFAPRVVGVLVTMACRALEHALKATSLNWFSSIKGSSSCIMLRCSSSRTLMNKGCSRGDIQLLFKHREKMRSIRDSDGTITPLVLTRKVKLSKFHGAGRGGKLGGSATCISIAEGLVPRIESSLIWIVHVEVSQEKTQAQTPAKALQRTLRLAMTVGDRAATIKLPNPDKVVTSKEQIFMINRRMWAQNIFPNQK